MADNDINVAGSCQCGSISVKVDGAPILMAQCHCRDCQKASGTGHMSMVFMPETVVEINGDATEYSCTTDAGNTSTRYFCPTCGSRMFGKNNFRPGVLAIPVGVFDDRDWFKPGAVVYCANRDEWDVTDDSIPNFDAMPPPPPEA